MHKNVMDSLGCTVTIEGVLLENTTKGENVSNG